MSPQVQEGFATVLLAACMTSGVPGTSMASGRVGASGILGTGGVSGVMDTGVVLGVPGADMASYRVSGFCYCFGIGYEAEGRRCWW